IAILDTGVDSKHEDIKANYTSVVKISDDDPRGHGTHCAGIAAAVTNNGVGVASYSRNNAYTSVTSIKVLSKMGFGSQKMIINGILKAADKGADVISMSLGGPSNDLKQKAYSDAVAYANKKGAIVVAAAGNSNANSKNYGPVNAKGIIGVSAVDSELKKASFSNTVQDIKMGIAAPGVGIYSTIPGSQYATYNGTSMATPYVAGLLGLMKSINPDIKTNEAYKILKNTGVKTGSTRETGMFIQPAAVVKELTNK
ncbi:MAG: S8 family serine peptidase, partial [Bacteroidota bacterium]